MLPYLFDLSGGFYERAGMEHHLLLGVLPQRVSTTSLGTCRVASAGWSFRSWHEEKSHQANLRFFQIEVVLRLSQMF